MVGRGGPHAAAHAPTGRPPHAAAQGRVGTRTRHAAVGPRRSWAARSHSQQCHCRRHHAQTARAQSGPRAHAGAGAHQAVPEQGEGGPEHGARRAAEQGTRAVVGRACTCTRAAAWCHQCMAGSSHSRGWRWSCQPRDQCAPPQVRNSPLLRVQEREQVRYQEERALEEQRAQVGAMGDDWVRARRLQGAWRVAHDGPARPHACASMRPCQGSRRHSAQWSCVATTLRAAAAAATKAVWRAWWRRRWARA